MRARSYGISTNHEKIEPRPKNIALFMPYLHWETDRRRAKATEAIRKTRPPRWAALDDVIDETEKRDLEGTFNRVTSGKFSRA